MKKVIQTLAVITAVVAIAGAAWAGECCTKNSAKAKKGEACAECVKGKCCKESIKKLGADAKACSKCTKKS